jgi:hypothetical protein
MGYIITMSTTMLLDQPPYVKKIGTRHGLKFPLEELQVTARLLQVTISFAEVRCR